jgi:hypothetical protein
MNGGMPENIVSGRDLDTPKRRYWMEARTAAGYAPKHESPAAHQLTVTELATPAGMFTTEQAIVD